jgi:GH15 family glucan-1,4-alpha-glucosidase
VRTGNDAYQQYQGDVLGELMVALHRARVADIQDSEFSWSLQRTLVEFVADHWRRADNGMWEIRGPERNFTHSRVMVWAALDRGVKAVRDFGMIGPARHWESLREQVRADIESHAWDSVRGTYTQYYGGSTVDASLLQLEQVGFCAPEDPRMLGTVAAIEEDLSRDGLLLRYQPETGVDGLPGDDEPFLACSFWLVEHYARVGELHRARTLMDRLIGISNDVGLLAEEFDTVNGKQSGNVPQALSHLALVRAADAIELASTRTDATDELRLGAQL